MRYAPRGLRLAVLAIAAAAPLSSCTLIRRLVDRIAPPVTALDQRFASVEASRARLPGFVPSLGVFVSSDVVDTLVAVGIGRAAASRPEEVVIDELTTRTTLVEQGILLEAVFDAVVKERNIRAAGRLRGVIGVAAVGDTVELRPALELVDVRRLRRETGAGAVDRAAEAAVRGILRTFVANINGALAADPITVDAQWSDAVSVNVDSLVRGTGVEVSSEVRTVQRHLRDALIHVGPKGISVLAMLAADRRTSERPAGAAPGTAPTPSRELFFRRYSEYTDGFFRAWHSTLDTVASGPMVQVSLAKGELASLLNELTDHPLKAAYRFTVPASQFSTVVEAPKSSVDCQKVYQPFKRQRYQRRSCSWNCQRCVTVLGVRACTDDPVCEATRGACNVKEEAKVAEDNLEWEAERARHNVKQEAEVAACNVWRETTSILAIGRFAGGLQAKGTAELQFQGIRFADNLEAVHLKELALDVAGDAEMRMRITPHDLGHIFFCVAPTDVTWKGNYAVRVPRSGQTLRLASSQERGEVVLKLRVPEIAYEATATPPPLTALMTNPRFLSVCAVGATTIFGTLPLAKAAGLLGFEEGTQLFDAALGRYRGTQAESMLQHTIRPLIVDLDGAGKIIGSVQLGARSVNVTGGFR